MSNDGEPVKPPRRRRQIGPRVTPADHAERAPLSLVPVGGFVALWRTLTGKPAGVSISGDAGLTVAFLTCILFGTVLCLVGTTSFPLARQIGFAGPLLATLAYPIWGWAAGAATKPSLRERLADNSYYLGFIFTQIALLVGFLPAAFGTTRLDADQIIRFFGVALGASLVGLVARTVLIQMSYTLDEAADVVAGEVSALARQVTEQSSAVLENFEMLVARLALTHAKLTVELNGSMASLVETIGRYNAAMQADATTLHAGVVNASNAAERAASDVEVQRVHLTESTRDVAEAIKQLHLGLETHLRGSTDTIQATTAALEQEVRTSTEELRLATGAIQRGLGSLTAVSNLQEGVSQLEGRFGAVTDQLAVIDARAVAIGSEVDASLRSLGSEIEDAKARSLDRVATISSETDEAVSALERTLDRFRAELERLRG